MKHIMYKFAAVAIVCAVAIAFVAPQSLARIRTTRGKLQAAAKNTVVLEENKCTKIAAPLAVKTVSMSRYDKPLRSNKEALAATNISTTDTIVGLWLTLNYSDLSGKQLHRRSQMIRNILIPPGETRTLSFPSWDKQKSFYYAKSAVGHTPRTVTAFEVEITADTVYVKNIRQE